MSKTAYLSPCMSRKNIISRSDSDYYSPIYLIKKDKNKSACEENTRVILDCRGPNAQCLIPTIPSRSGFQCLQEVRNSGARVYSTLDMSSSFHHLQYEDEQSKNCTSFTVDAGPFLTPDGKTTPNGHWRLNRLSMGHNYSSYCLAKAIQKTFEDVLSMSTFVDDIILYTEKLADHIERLDQVFHNAIKF